MRQYDVPAEGLAHETARKRQTAGGWAIMLVALGVAGWATWTGMPERFVWGGFAVALVAARIMPVRTFQGFLGKE